MFSGKDLPLFLIEEEEFGLSKTGSHVGQGWMAFVCLSHTSQARHFFILHFRWVIPLSSQAKQYVHHVEKKKKPEPGPDNYKVASRFRILWIQSYYLLQKVMFVMQALVHHRQVHHSPTSINSSRISQGRGGWDANSRGASKALGLCGNLGYILHK